MYGQDQAKSPTVSGQEKQIQQIGVDMADSLNGLDPANQNEVVRVIISVLRERRQLQLDDAHKHANYLGKSLEDLNGIPSPVGRNSY